jgi:hypothetical protein
MFDYKKPPSEFDCRNFFLLHIAWLATVLRPWHHACKILGHKKKHANVSLQGVYVFMNAADT